MSQLRRLSSKTIDDFTKLGYCELQSGHLNTAIEAFKNAHRHSVYLNDVNTEQLCAFNLGAAYVAAKKPREGLELLSTAVPPCKQPEEKPKGDVYYNFGLGYETMDNMDETIKYFELALEAYEVGRRDVPTSRKILTVARKLGFCYGKIGSHSQAVSRLKIVTKLQEELEEGFRERIPVLCELSSQLAVLDKYLEALHYTDECFTYCGQLEDSLNKGEIYHDLGLIYVHCKEYSKGCCCFELALPLVRTVEPRGKKEAAVIQNLGACYNALGDYQRAVGFHEQALESYSCHFDQSGQAQCFNNLAFAFINLGDLNGAEEAHMHALRASIQTGDSHNQWQSLEGLGTVAFNKGQVDDAIGHFRESVKILAASEENYPAHHRLLSKYSDSVKYKDLYAVRSVPPPPVINASMSVNFSESYQRTGKFFDEEKEKDKETVQELEHSKTSSNLIDTVYEGSETDSVFSEMSSEGLETEDMYQTDTMLRRYKEQQLAKKQTLTGLRKTKSENLSNIPKGRSAVEVVSKLLSSRPKSFRATTRNEYVSKSRRLRQSLLRKSADQGLPQCDSESEDSADYYYQKEDEKVEPEHADRLSMIASQGQVTVDLVEKKAKFGKSRKYKPVPKQTQGQPSRSKKLLRREEAELKSQIENDGFLRAFKEIEIDGADGAGRKRRAKKKRKVSKNGARKKQKGSMNKSGDSGVFEEVINPEGAAVQKSELLLDLSQCTNSDSDDDSNEVKEEVVIASSAQADQSAPNTEAIESDTIAGSSLTQVKEKNGKPGRALPQRKSKKEICGKSTDVVDSTKPGVAMETETGNTEESDQQTSRFLDKAVQTPRRKKSIVCTLM
ncbi:uncharacterized protein LOC135483250 [Lineus longissimus]|uniref:uncharacterized protein LOC135483250 n=1 Tax=Lineus longissimus TaxID=88925 RepID=UPI00315CEBBC